MSDRNWIKAIGATALVVCLASAPLAHAGPIDVRLDLRNNATNPGGTWNTRNPSTSAVELIDYNTGTGSGISFIMLNTFGQDKSYTNQWDNVFTGPSWLDSNQYAAEDGLYEIGNDLYLKFTGLDVGTQYDVEVIASASVDANTTRYLIYKFNNVPFDGSSNGYWNAAAAYNNGTWMTWSDISPNASGEMTLAVTSYDDNYAGRDRVVNAVRITAIPEPASLGLLGLGALLFLRRRRFHHS